jgi:chromosome condensin MukBEF ATPase and DNA-binding subunit MukB
MPNPTAKVGSIDSLRLFRAAMLKFAEAASIALADADGEISRTMGWLEGEQEAHWRGELRKRSEIANRCKDAVRQKKLYKDSTGRQQSAVDEEKALAIAQRRLAEAEQKLENVRRSRARLRKETDQYKGHVQRFATSVQHDLPVAAARLEKMMMSLEAYVELAAPDTEAVSQPPPATTEESDPKPEFEI